ncbi:alanine--tRNA ligase, partial [Candidatus Falkowbacteria bacterium]|nr:alanine--tRNA ligase [Candidatus Falkowbacteria bacterium]
MTTQKLRKKYLEFFHKRGHAIISSASLIPENDPSVLFTTAGMHPLVPYLLGEKHPAGQCLVNAQKCIRTSDIDDVGDNRHLTFFEMLGNWSLGDPSFPDGIGRAGYFKKEAIVWSFEFLTLKKWLGLDPKRLYITVFRGDEKDGIGLDEESIKIWQEQFGKIEICADVSLDGDWNNNAERIFALGKDENWWGLVTGGPCGPCSEMFYDVYPERGFETGKSFERLVEEGRFVEVWNDVFMEYNRKADGSLEPLKQKNVDTGMGLERTTAILNGEKEVFDIAEFQEIFEKIEKLSGKKYAENKNAFRIIADHLRAGAFILGDEKAIAPSNILQGYVLRRLIRRAIRYGKQLGINENFTAQIAKVVVKQMKKVYPELKKNRDFIVDQLNKEEEKFAQTLEKGTREFNRMAQNKKISGRNAFVLFSTYGFPLEMTEELAREAGANVDREEFDAEFKKHQELSKTASAGMFKGGLADSSEQTKRLHTAAHLMLEAMRQVLGEHVEQRGSNITAERLRFDFSHGEKMTVEQIKKVEEIVNGQIGKKLEVRCEELSLDEAKKIGAIGIFEHKYGDKVKVYSIGAFSREICGGPHANNTA